MGLGLGVGRVRVSPANRLCYLQGDDAFQMCREPPPTPSPTQAELLQNTLCVSQVVTLGPAAAWDGGLGGGPLSGKHSVWACVDQHWGPNLPSGTPHPAGTAPGQPTLVHCQVELAPEGRWRGRRLAGDSCTPDWVPLGRAPVS